MGTASGEQTIFGIGPNETSYGVPAGAVDRFYELLPGETLHKEVLSRPVPGLRGGTRNLQTLAKDRRVGEQASGGIPLLVPTIGAGRLFQHITGGTPAITGAGAAKTHVYSIGTLLGKSFNAQKQLRDSAGTPVEEFTYNGCKMITGRFTIDADGYLQLELTLDARQEEHTTAAATAAYTTLVPFAYEEGVLSVNGSPLTDIVVSSNIEFGNPSVINKRRLGSGGFKKEPTSNGKPTVSGEMTIDFQDTVIYDHFSAQDQVSLQLKFTSTDVIPTTATPFSVQIDVPALHFKGNTPQVANESDVTVPIPWTAGANAAGDPGASITYITSDTAP